MAEEEQAPDEFSMLRQDASTREAVPDWAADEASGAPDWAADEKPERAWSDVPLEAVKNIPSSAVEFGKNIVQPIIHPIDTAVALKNLGHGVLQKTGLASGHENEQYADAVGKFLVDRYGSMDAVKKTLAEDPVGLAADISMLLTGGGAAAARAPGLIGKAGEIAGAVGRGVDPLVGAAKAVEGAAKGAGYVGSEIIGNVGTHTGGKSLRTAAEAGYEGGDAAQAFRENLRGQAPMEEVVQEARNVIPKMAAERGAEYNAGMAGVRADNTILNFDKVNAALADATKVKTFKGVPLDPSTQAVRQEIGQAIQQWKMYDPKEFHTAEGLDALKQLIGDIKVEPHSPAEKVKTQAYQAIRNTITAQAPQYVKVMKGYEDASRHMKELEKALSLGRNASTDTALRKLQSVLRNNVSSNYGNREAMAAYLATHGAPQLMEKLAGQSLNAMAPRGLGKLALSLGGPLASFLGAGAGPAIAALPMMSPRLMGEAAYLGGRAAAGVRSTVAPGAKLLKPAVRPAYQVKRATEEEKPAWARALGGTIGRFDRGGAPDDAPYVPPPPAPVQQVSGPSDDDGGDSVRGGNIAGLGSVPAEFDPQGFNFGPPYTASPNPHHGPVMDPEIWLGPGTDNSGRGGGVPVSETAARLAREAGMPVGSLDDSGNIITSSAPPPGALDWSSDNGIPKNWQDFAGTDSSTGGGFYTIHDLVNRHPGADLPVAFQQGEDLPSTNNWRLLPMQDPRYVMRNGRIIDMQSYLRGPPGTEGDNITPGPRWGSGNAFGVPAAWMSSQDGWVAMGWPGQVQQYGYIPPGNKRGGSVPRLDRGGAPDNTDVPPPPPPAPAPLTGGLGDYGVDPNDPSIHGKEVTGTIALSGDHYVDDAGHVLMGAPDANGMFTIPVTGSGQFAGQPQGYNFGPPYTDASTYHHGADMAPQDWLGPTDDSGRGADATSGAPPPGMLNYGPGADSGVPLNWKDFSGTDSSTGGGFYTIADLYARRGEDVPTAFQSSSTQPSTNNYRMLPPMYRQPNYIMRNGFIIDMNNASMPGVDPSWKHGGAGFGFPTIISQNRNSALAGWPGQLGNWATILNGGSGSDS